MNVILNQVTNHKRDIKRTITNAPTIMMHIMLVTNKETREMKENKIITIRSEKETMPITKTKIIIITNNNLRFNQIVKHM